MSCMGGKFNYRLRNIMKGTAEKGQLLSHTSVKVGRHLFVIWFKVMICLCFLTIDNVQSIVIRIEVIICV